MIANYKNRFEVKMTSSGDRGKLVPSDLAERSSCWRWYQTINLACLKHVGCHSFCCLSDKTLKTLACTRGLLGMHRAYYPRISLDGCLTSAWHSQINARGALLERFYTPISFFYKNEERWGWNWPRCHEQAKNVPNLRLRDKAFLFNSEPVFVLS